MGDLHELVNALPQPVSSSVSLLDALPDPRESSALVVDHESKPSLLESSPVAMSAAESYAVLTHHKEEDEAGPRKKARRSASEPQPERKRVERKARGKQLKARARGNQRSKIDKKNLDW